MTDWTDATTDTRRGPIHYLFNGSNACLCGWNIDDRMRRDLSLNHDVIEHSWNAHVWTVRQQYPANHIAIVRRHPPSRSRSACWSMECSCGNKFKLRDGSDSTFFTVHYMCLVFQQHIDEVLPVESKQLTEKYKEVERKKKEAELAAEAHQRAESIKSRFID